MRILIIGSGGREHALAWKLKQSPLVSHIFVAPGNGGTESLAVNIPVADNDIPGLVALARKEAVDLVVPGPELPLTLGITDAMNKAGIACFGPTAACARLEGSKAFAKSIMLATGVPTANSGVFSRREEALAFARKLGLPVVIKADGLAAGKGVVIARSDAETQAALEDMLERDRFGTAGHTVVVEQYLQGEEVSLMCFCDGEAALPLPSAQDHKAVFDGDAGPNTGGMGAYSPAPLLPAADLEKMTDLTIRPVLAEMVRRGSPYRGILYAGLLFTPNGPYVLEYNVRFGDPECQPLLMRLENDIADLMLACCQSRLNGQRLRIREGAALCVVLTAAGYPGDYPKGMTVTGIEKATSLGDVQVFQAGTKLLNKVPVAAGGRILCVAAQKDDLASACRHAYLALEQIRMDHSHFRYDIGKKGLAKQKDTLPKVAVFMGSKSDEAVVAPCVDLLKKWKIPCRVTVASAHRTPERVENLIKELDHCLVFICAAGMAAHLAGAVAARTLKPVIGIPMSGAALGGLDALLSTVQMPPGFPVATVALDTAGARNAAWLAAQILALNDPKLAALLRDERNRFQTDVETAGRELESRHNCT